MLLGRERYAGTVPERQREVRGKDNPMGISTEKEVKDRKIRQLQDGVPC